MSDPSRLLQRLLALAAPAPRRRRSRARPAGDRAGHAAACGHGHDAPHVRLGRRRPRARRLRRQACSAPRHPRRGIAERSDRAAGRVLVSIFLDGGAERSRSSPRPATRSTGRCGRHSRSAPDGGTPFATDPTLRWHPAAALARDAPRRGQADRLPGGRLHDRRRLALHVAPLLGGRRDRGRRSARAGWAAISTASARTTTRCRACRSAGASRRRSRRPSARSATLAAPRTTVWRRAASAGRARRSMLDGVGGARRRARREPRRRRLRTGRARQRCSRGS